MLSLNKQQQLSWSHSCAWADSLKSLAQLRRNQLWRRNEAFRGQLFLPPSSRAFHVSLNCVSYCQRAREASSGDVNRTPPSRLRVIKELLLGGNLEQCLERAQAANLGETFPLLNGAKGHWRPVLLFIKSIRHQGAVPAKQSKVNMMILRRINDTRSQRSP